MCIDIQSSIYLFSKAEAMSNRYPQSLMTFSLVKSKEMLQKISNHLDNMQSNRQNSAIIQSIQSSSQKIQSSLDVKIEQQFTLMLNSPTMMVLDPVKTEPQEKENKMATNTTALEGSKALMYNYWERNKKKSENPHKKPASGKNLEARKSESKLPNINQVGEFRISNLIKAKQKEQQSCEIPVKKTQPKEQYHIKIKIVEYKCQNETKAFFKFQKTYFKRWKEISSIIQGLERFAQYYHLPLLTVQSQSIFDLIDRIAKGWKMNTHDLLACCQNAQTISQQNCSQAGIRFYGPTGKLRATVLIQSHIRKYLAKKRYCQKLLQWRSAKKIQSHYRCYLLSKYMKRKIFERQLQKLQKFNTLQKYFCANYRRKEIESRIKYQIHIPSHNYSQWQKISMQKYIERQNSELCRIFKIAQQNHLCDVRIIYVSPINLSKEIINYYKKLLEIASDEKLQHKLTIISPIYDKKLPTNLSLAQLLYYEAKTLKKIKSIVRNNYAYIVPSTPSNHYVHLCHLLSIPLYTASPQKIAYLSTKSGCKSFQEELSEFGQASIGVLPYSMDIYNQTSFLNELTNLIYRYPYVRRWVLKIDNETKSRGLAYIDVSKILGKQFVADEQSNKSQQKAAREHIYSLLQVSLIVNKEQRIIPIDKQAYPNQQQYLKHYYTRGGIIEASINNMETDLQNMCFSIDLEPDGQWKFLSNYYKITNKHKTIAAYYDSALLKPPLEIDCLVKQLKKQKVFGYFTFQFLSINHSLQKTMKKTENKLYYLNSIECHLNELSSAHYLRSFIAKDSNALFVPMVQHPAIKQLRMQTFFHLCRLQNISFDIENKVGNVFTFMDGLEGGCLGIMTFNDSSKQACYAHTAEVLDFLNSKLRQNNSLKDVPRSFFSVKNAINGFLNRGKRRHYKSEKGLVPA